MKQAKAALLFLSVCALGAVPLRAAISSDAGTQAANVLSLRPGVRAASMAGAFTAVADDLSAQAINPAGLGQLKHIELSAMYESLFQDIHHSYAGIALPLDQLTASNVHHLGTFAAGFQFLDYGYINGRDAAGTPTVNLGSYDAVIHIGYGKAIARQLYLGVNAKLYRLGIYERESRDTAFDAGALYEVLPGKCRLGVAVRNLGSQAKFGQVEEDLPRSVAGGVSVTPFGDRARLAMDVEQQPDEGLRVKTGLEVWANSIFALRAGYDSVRDNANTGLTAGMGIRIREFEAGFFPIHEILLDYAFLPSSDLGSTHTVSLTFRFGD